MGNRLSGAQALVPAHEEHAKTLTRLLEKALERPPAEGVDRDLQSRDGMARLAASLEISPDDDAAAEDEEPIVSSPFLGVAQRIDAMYGNNPKPPPGTVWARDLLKEPTREE